MNPAKAHESEDTSKVVWVERVSKDIKGQPEQWLRNDAAEASGNS